MSEAGEITASSLAVVEKKPRPGGCVGVFFQLFDWNRRFAKKKLFSKKLFSPGRLKQGSKKFGGDEKQSKHRLIADENSGGFPNGKKGSLDIEPRREGRAPSLVAKLMGLESMPSALQREKSKKVRASSFESKKAEKVEDLMGAYSSEELNVGKGRSSNDLRPPKLQKTSGSERRTMTRFGADTLPIKNILSRSKKYPPKLPVPMVKSPRNLSRKHSSKLIGAATRILEPGLHVSRSNRAITYSNTQHHPPTSNVLMEDSDNFERVIPRGQSCCVNCGHMLNDDNLGPKHCSNQHPFTFTPSSRVEFSCQSPERSKTGRSQCDRDFEEDLHEDDYPATGPAFVDKFRPRDNQTTDVSSFTAQMQQNSSIQQLKPKKDLPPSLRSNQRMQNYNPMLQLKSNDAPRSKFVSPPSNPAPTATVVDERKSFASSNRSFVSSNRSSSGNSRMGNIELEKRISMRQNDFASPAQKRRSVNVPRQSEGSVFMNSAVKRQTHGTISHAVSNKDSGYNAHSSGQQSRKCGPPHVQPRAVGTSPKNNDSISFTFSSQAKQKTGVNAVEKRRVRNDSGNTGTRQKSAPTENVREKFDRPATISGDALGALLQQKLKELNSQGEDTGSHAPKKTTAMILQELISALTTEMPFAQDNLESSEETKNHNESRMTKPKSYTSTKAKAMAVKLPADQSVGSEHLSPGSVLEAFSSESCVSSSRDDNLGFNMSNESMECCSSSEIHSFNPDSELSDSADSIIIQKSSKDLVIDIHDIVSETLCCINLANYGLKGCKLDHAREVLLNAELMFQSASDSGSALNKESSIKHLLLDELETLATVLWMNFGPASGVQHSGDVNQLTGFAFDSIIEYLASRFDRYYKSGSKVSQKLPLFMSTNLILFDIVEEVRKWKELTRFVNGEDVDELVGLEMIRSLREWTEFEQERSETCNKVSKKILHTLLDEIVEDLCYC